MYATYNAPLVQLSASEVSGNAAWGPEGGGAVYFNSPRGILRLEAGTALANNTAAGGGGGAVMVESALAVLAEDATFSGNVARGGGALGFARINSLKDVATCVNGVRAHISPLHILLLSCPLTLLRT